MPTDDSWPETNQLIEHRQWRPDWTTERPCLYWYLTFENQPSLWSACHELTTVLEEVDSVDVIPREWLHLTLLEVGFVDEVDQEELAAVVSAATEAVASYPQLQLELGPVSTMIDSVVLRAQPTPELLELQRRLDSALRGVRDPAAGSEEFWPHVSLGYLNQPCERASIIEALRADPAVTAISDPDDLSITVSGPQLTFGAVTRRLTHYEWREVAILALGTAREQDLTG